MSKLPFNSLAYAMQQASRILAGVMAGQSLADGALGRVDVVARPAVQDLVYSTLRDYGRGAGVLARLLERPLTDVEIHALLLVAIQRLEARPENAHTIVDQAVSAAAECNGGHLRGLVNGVLRSYLRRRDELLAALASDEMACWQHPDWWIEVVRDAWPSDWQAILQAGNQPPPMALRVNTRRMTAADYLDRLTAAGINARADGEALLLEKPVPVDRLPGFADGLVSVQDPGAQRAAFLLDPAPGSRVLDACAAPGGKTAHLLEHHDLDLLAIDLKPARCRRIEENLSRLGLTAGICVGDCAKPEKWWDGRPFDAILADVPCSASGVARRNPDIKWLRRPEDIASFAAAQARILEALWPMLKVGGKLLYATCSVFPAENAQQIAAFLNRHPDAERCFEEQLLPDADHDGFFYSLLAKRA
jgi:16S rRNA (cytosine967-C5)-methyltransferase